MGGEREGWGLDHISIYVWIGVGGLGALGGLGEICAGTQVRGKFSLSTALGSGVSSQLRFQLQF